MRKKVISFILFSVSLSSFAFQVNMDAYRMGAEMYQRAQEEETRRREMELREKQFEMQRRQYEQQRRLEEQQRRQMQLLEIEKKKAMEEKARITKELERLAAQEKEQKAISSGSGFFVSKSGHIITNAHVVLNKSYFMIRERSGKIHQAEVIGASEKYDLALLKIKGIFPYLTVGVPKIVEKGQRVYAIGYPAAAVHGLESKITDGIINSLSGPESGDHWMQISAPVQGGNSGGPLVNEAGIVVGVIVASADIEKYVRETGSFPQNVNFAIKVEALRDYLWSENISLRGDRNKKSSLNDVDAAVVMVLSRKIPFESVQLD
ncbi:Trypsin-like peptidase domain-containing protein [Oryzisolibacter propanilivorax]|uniref:Trypsin-like peptidase domain-containing protein n=1 Tax=Oryzisolibacter propanilivorax TaxID=1527607 RepID=A0A1G9RFF8_9BURK|nr:serine protease [Oryzisolibacter propanilivorax]SDM21810.1 Trypsin-like peptidase domain-containing protein [Oryzisolibacter propanilivorax]